MGKLIRHGMAAAGRYLQLRVRIPDVPGGLASCSASSPSLGANVLEVSHERLSVELHLDEVEVRLQLETRGLPHAEPWSPGSASAATPSSTDPSPRGLGQAV